METKCLIKEFIVLIQTLHLLEKLVEWKQRR